MAGNKFPVLVYSFHFGFKARDTFWWFHCSGKAIPSLSLPPPCQTYLDGSGNNTYGNQCAEMGY